MNGVHGTNSQSLRKPDYSSGKRMIFNPLEKVFPRKFTDPGVRLQTSTDFNKHALERTNALVSFDSHSIIRSNGLRNKVDTTPRISPNKKDSFSRKGGPIIKMANHMPLSAKHATSTPIKVFVNVGDHMGLGGRKSSAVKGPNDSHDRDTKDISGFLIKKPTAAMVNLKLDKGLASTRGASFERDPKSSALAKIDLLNNRRRSSRGLEQSNDSIANRKEKPYVSNEFFGPISTSAKRDLDSSSKSKVKLTSQGLGHVDLEKENWRKTSAMKSKVNTQPVGSIFSKGSSTSLKTKLPPTISTNHPTHKPPALTNIVTQVNNFKRQVNEEDMNRLGNIFGQNETFKEEPDRDREDSPGRKITKREYMQAKLPYYIGGVSLFFHDPKKDYFSTLYKEHFRHTFFSLKFCKTLQSATAADLAVKQRHYPQRLPSDHKKCLVLDLDETLIHCVTTAGQTADIYLPIKFPSGDTIKAPINVRPFAVKFLEQMAKLFEVFVFTASNSCYADVVLDHLDPDRKLVSHRLYRESCLQTPNGMFVKDLRVIGGRDLEELVLVDNASYSFGFQLDSGIPIIPFYDSRQDIELLSLAKYLERLAHSKSMKETNRKAFRLREIADCNSVDEAYRLYGPNTASL